MHLAFNDNDEKEAFTWLRYYKNTARNSLVNKILIIISAGVTAAAECLLLKAIKMQKNNSVYAKLFIILDPWI